MHDFPHKLKILEEHWSSLEKHHKVSRPGVFNWFKIDVAPIIRDNLNQELLASLGIDGEKYTQNNSEAANAYKFIDDLEECVKEQQNEVNKSIVGLGYWSLVSSYDYMKQNVDAWFGHTSQMFCLNRYISSNCYYSCANHIKYIPSAASAIVYPQ